MHAMDAFEISHYLNLVVRDSTKCGPHLQKFPSRYILPISTNIIWWTKARKLFDISGN
jgi:hypothetical protein